LFDENDDSTYGVNSSSFFNGQSENVGWGGMREALFVVYALYFAGFSYLVI